MTTDPGYEDILTRDASSRLRFNWRNGAELEVRATAFADEVQAPFELYGHEVAAGRYHGLRHAAAVGGPGRKVARAVLSYEYLDLFGGHAHQPRLNLTLRPTRHVTMEATYTHLVGAFATTRAFNFGYANATFELALTRNLLWDNLLRFSLAPGDERVGLQSRVRWRFLPGSDLYLVYRTDQPVYLRADDIPFHELTLKVSVYLRALVGGRRANVSSAAPGAT